MGEYRLTHAWFLTYSSRPKLWDWKYPKYPKVQVLLPVKSNVKPKFESQSLKPVLKYFDSLCCRGAQGLSFPDIRNKFIPSWASNMLYLDQRCIAVRILVGLWPVAPKRAGVMGSGLFQTGITWKRSTMHYPNHPFGGTVTCCPEVWRLPSRDAQASWLPRDYLVTASCRTLKLTSAY